MVAEIVTNPLVIGSMAGIFFWSFGILIPQSIVITLSSISKLATPLAFIVLGGTLQFDNLKKNLRYTGWASFFRLIGVPEVVLPLGILMGIRNHQLVALFVVTASPAAVSSFTMAKEAGVDGELAGEIVAQTLIFFIATIFLWIVVLKNLGISDKN